MSRNALVHDGGLEDADARRRDDIDDVARREALGVGRAERLHDVQLARLESGELGGGGCQPDEDLGEFRRAQKVVGVGVRLDVLIGDVLDESKRPGADRRVLGEGMLVERGRIGIAQDVLGQDPDERVVVCRPDQEGDVWLLQDDFHRVVIDHLQTRNLVALAGTERLRALDLGELVVLAGRDLFHHRQAVGEDDVAGGEGLAIVPGHVLPQKEGELGSIRRDLEPFGQIGDEVVIGVEANKAAEDQVEHLCLRPSRRPKGKPGPSRFGLATQLQHPGGLVCLAGTSKVLGG